MKENKLVDAICQKIFDKKGFNHIETKQKEDWIMILAEKKFQ